ncbi:flagellar hook-length control protein FliK [Prosthecomicrobium pneumaticum]|uniref:Flagellar hook-length control protein-like C-terminal domain-containing protein n=1 Tax=Prosthecomicrobium pneumaticum TaxID=81895 RepID=A0A7W9CT15_9HYPH|nr:flagellar hook-length control protein FliK [Prosthecomicrobium pneumaticum]MBB5751011.1 hypothetical protein [Prosthecomicrobium pneumaticum]
MIPLRPSQPQAATAPGDEPHPRRGDVPGGADFDALLVGWEAPAAPDAAPRSAAGLRIAGSGESGAADTGAATPVDAEGADADPLGSKPSGPAPGSERAPHPEPDQRERAAASSGRAPLPLRFERSVAALRTLAAMPQDGSPQTLEAPRVPAPPDAADRPSVEGSPAAAHNPFRSSGSISPAPSPGDPSARPPAGSVRSDRQTPETGAAALQGAVGENAGRARAAASPDVAGAPAGPQPGGTSGGEPPPMAVSADVRSGRPVTDGSGTPTHPSRQEALKTPTLPYRPVVPAARSASLREHSAALPGAAAIDASVPPAPEPIDPAPARHRAAEPDIGTPPAAATAPAASAGADLAVLIGAPAPPAAAAMVETSSRAAEAEADPGPRGLSETAAAEEDAGADAVARMPVRVVLRETHFAPVLPQDFASRSVPSGRPAVERRFAIALDGAPRPFAEPAAAPTGWAAAGPGSPADLPARHPAETQTGPTGGLPPAYAAPGSVALGSPTFRDGESPSPASQIADRIARALAASPAAEAAGQGAAGAPGPVRILEIALHPTTLGVVTVRLRSGRNGVEISVHAARPETARLLAEGRAALVTSLVDAGCAPSDLVITGNGPVAGLTGHDAVLPNMTPRSDDAEAGGGRRRQEPAQQRERGQDEDDDDRRGSDRSGAR